MNASNAKRVAIAGATATGKSALGIHLAARFDGEIVSMDSRQVYRGLDIGTGKVTREERRMAPHHLVDILDPREATSAGSHADRTRRAILDIESRGKTPFLVGGTGLYFDALFSPLISAEIAPERSRSIRARLEDRGTKELYGELSHTDPARAAQLSPNDRLRIVRALEVFFGTGKRQSDFFAAQTRKPDEGEWLKIVLTMPREMLRQRIANRTREMFASGWVDEVRGLLDGGCPVDAPGMNSIGYAEIARAILAGLNPTETMDAVITSTQQYAKRQETFFRRDKDALWIDVTRDDFVTEVESRVEAFLHP